MIIGHVRGWPIYWDGEKEEWHYLNSDAIFDDVDHVLDVACFRHQMDMMAAWDMLRGLCLLVAGMV